MMTRLIIYLLAMMTGFSAAEAARPVSSTPATLGSAVANDAVIAVMVASDRDEAVSASFAEIPSVAVTATTSKPVEPTGNAASSSSPVTRHDITRQ